MGILLMTNGTIEAKLFIQEIEKIVHLEAVIIQEKCSIVFFVSFYEKKRRRSHA